MESNLFNQLFHSPKDVGDIESATAIGKAGSLVCGATLRITLRVDDQQKIEAAKFRAAGCSYLVASASFITDYVKGNTTGDAAAFSQNLEATGLEQLGSPPAGREHCTALACEALISAIRQYSDSIRNEWEEDEALICTCFCVSERTIEREIIAGGLRTIADVTKACYAGGGCQSCYSLIEDILSTVNDERSIR